MWHGMKERKSMLLLLIFFGRFLDIKCSLTVGFLKSLLIIFLSSHPDHHTLFPNNGSLSRFPRETGLQKLEICNPVHGGEFVPVLANCFQSEEDNHLAKVSKSASFSGKTQDLEKSGLILCGFLRNLGIGGLSQRGLEIGPAVLEKRDLVVIAFVV